MIKTKKLISSRLCVGKQNHNTQFSFLVITSCGVILIYEAFRELFDFRDCSSNFYEILIKINNMIRY